MYRRDSSYGIHNINNPHYETKNAFISRISARLRRVFLVHFCRIHSTWSLLHCMSAKRRYVGFSWVHFQRRKRGTNVPSVYSLALRPVSSMFEPSTCSTRLVLVSRHPSHRLEATVRWHYRLSFSERSEFPTCIACITDLHWLTGNSISD